MKDGNLVSGYFKLGGKCHGVILPQALQRTIIAIDALRECGNKLSYKLSDHSCLWGNCPQN